MNTTAASQFANVPEVQEAIVSFERWRANRTKREQYPQELRLRAIRLAQIYGVTNVGRALKYNRTRLRQLVERTLAERGTQGSAHGAQEVAEKQTFVPVVPLSFMDAMPSVPPRATCVVEVLDAKGGKMVMTFHGASPEVENLMGAFWRRA